MPTKIQWCEESWNPVTGCTPVSEGCRHCYARRMAKRLQAMGQEKYRDGFQVRTHPDCLDEPLRWKTPRMVFVCSMGDLFLPEITEGFLYQVFSVIQRTPQHTYLLLTKRAFTMRCWSDLWLDAVAPRGHYENIWWGVSAEHQEAADARTARLRSIPAAKRFLSLEPLLGPIDNLPLDGIDWVIVGCESGPGRRPTDIDWIRSIRNQCLAARVPFFLKQMDVDGKLVKMPELDGKVWDQRPRRSEPALKG